MIEERSFGVKVHGECKVERPCIDGPKEKKREEAEYAIESHIVNIVEMNFKVLNLKKSYD